MGVVRLVLMFGDLHGYETTTYAESTGLALDPEKPIAISVGEVKVIDVLPADIWIGLPAVHRLRAVGYVVD